MKWHQPLLGTQGTVTMPVVTKRKAMMDLLGNPAELALVDAVADDLLRDPGTSNTLLLPTLVLWCETAGVSAADVLRQALDRVTGENNTTSPI
jgi:hypothetical protein